MWPTQASIQAEHWYLSGPLQGTPVCVSVWVVGVGVGVVSWMDVYWNPTRGL